MVDPEVSERRRIDHWRLEGEYLLGRVVPALLDDRDRLACRLEIAEWDRERLRLEAVELRDEVSELQARFRAERAAIVEALEAVMDLLGQLHVPLEELGRRLHLSRVAAPSQAIV
jgi:hypothetical protein